MRKNKIFATLLLILFSTVLLSGCAGASTMNNAISWPGLSSDGTTAYVAYGNYVQAVADGKLLWRYPAEAEKNVMFFAAPLLDGEFIYAGTYQNEVHVLNKADGTFVAKIMLPSNKSKILASPTVADGTLLIPSNQGVIYAYRTDDLSNQLWRTPLSSEIWSSPLVLNGQVYVVTLDKKLHVLEMATGSVQKTLPIEGAVMSDLIVSDGKIYFSTFGKHVDAYDPETGEVRRVLDTDNEVWASPLILDDHIFVADMGGNLYFNTIADGASVWSAKNVTGEGQGVIANPILMADGNLLVITENGEMLVYDTEGKSVNTRSTKSKMLTSSVQIDDSVVSAVAQGDALLRDYTFDLKEDWIYADAAAATTGAQPTETAPSVTNTPAN